MRLSDLLDKARTNPAGLTFDELVELLEKLNWTFCDTAGGQQVWRSPDGIPITIEPVADGMADLHQIGQLLDCL